VNTHRLYRSRYDKQLAGVAGGMAEYLELDPTLVRILWILSVFLGGFTILLYIILAFIVPLAPVAAVPGPSWAPGGPSGGWGPGWAPAATPGGAPGAAEGETGSQGGIQGGTEGGDTTAALADASPTQGWNAAQAGWVDPAWTAGQGWSAPNQGADPATDRRRGPGAAVYVGVLLVVFGTIALADAVIPGLSGISLAPALLVALGVALMIGAIRRPADEA
jgi:phage shock protein C